MKGTNWSEIMSIRTSEGTKRTDPCFLPSLHARTLDHSASHRKSPLPNPMSTAWQQQHAQQLTCALLQGQLALIDCPHSMATCNPRSMAQP